jgi:ribosome modulation factor
MASNEQINGMEIFMKGYKAFQNDVDRMLNPYTFQSIEYAKWDQGWIEAEQEKLDEEYGSNDPVR